MHSAQMGLFQVFWDLLLAELESTELKDTFYQCTEIMAKVHTTSSVCSNNVYED